MGSLSGKTILLTRSEESNADIRRLFESREATVVSLPAIEFADPESWEACDRAIADIRNYDGFLFTSRTAVEQFLNRLAVISEEARQILAKKKIYAIGPKTREGLVAEKFQVADTPERFTGKELADTISTEDIAGKRFLFPKSEIAGDTLPDALRLKGALVDDVVVYRNVPPRPQGLDAVRAALLDGSIQVVVFFSPSAVRNLVQFVGIKALKSTAIAVIGPTTAKAVEDAGMTVNLIARQSTTESLIETLEQFFQSR